MCEGARHPGDPGMARTPFDHVDGGLYSLSPKQTSRFLARLITAPPRKKGPTYNRRSQFWVETSPEESGGNQLVLRNGLVVRPGCCDKSQSPSLRGDGCQDTRDEGARPWAYCHR
jgi:hypothetical protein